MTGDIGGDAGDFGWFPNTDGPISNRSNGSKDAGDVGDTGETREADVDGTPVLPQVLHPYRLGCTSFSYSAFFCRRNAASSAMRSTMGGSELSPGLTSRFG